MLLVGACTEAASVAGLTVDAFTGEPIGGVNVKLRSALNPTASREARSDETGRFAFSDVKETSYYPFAELEAYHRVSAVVHGAAIDAMNVKTGDRVEGGRILMARDAVIRGRVVDEDGAPVQGARVEAWPVPEDRPKIVREGKNGALTDANGEYRYVVTPGEYRITALAPWPRRMASAGVLFSQTFLFSSRHEAGGIMVEAVPFVETKHLDIALRLKTGLTISGNVSGIPTGEGRCDLYVESGGVDDLNYTRFYSFKSADRFELNDLHAGFYRVYARFWGSKISLHSQVLEFNLDAKNGRGLELILAPRFSVTGTVEAERGGLLERELYIRGMGPEFGLFAHSSVVHIRGDGTFEMPDLRADRYQLEAEPRSGYYIKRMMLGDTELKDGILDLGRGAPGATLKVVLGEMSASLTLKLVDGTGQPSKEGGVLVVRDGKGTLAECVMRWSSTTSMGWDGLAPGRYRIIRIFEPFPGILDADRIRQLSKDAELMEIHEGERLVRTLPMP
jgi:hypothetical protein